MRGDPRIIPPFRGSRPPGARMPVNGKITFRLSNGHSNSAHFFAPSFFSCFSTIYLSTREIVSNSTKTMLLLPMMPTTSSRRPTRVGSSSIISTRAIVFCSAVLLGFQYHYGSQVTNKFQQSMDLRYSSSWEAHRTTNSTSGTSAVPTHDPSESTRPQRQGRPALQGNDDSLLFLPACNTTGSSAPALWMECAPTSPITIDVILTVFKRENLLEQLNMVAAQSLQPSNIWVLQNENHQNISSIIQAWNDTRQPILSSRDNNTNSNTSPDDNRRRRPPPPRVHHLHFRDSDSKYHGRFHVAYMMSSATYVSIWDDDLSVGAGWLEHAVRFLQSQHDKAIVSSGGRLVQELPDEANEYETVYGRTTTDHNPQTLHWSGGMAVPVDFTVQHHTLRRELLRFYLGSRVYTYATGEDMQLSFALQRVGVTAYALESHRDYQAWASADTGLGANGPHASWKQKPQEPRLWLLCKLVQEGYRLVLLYDDECRNCKNATAVQACMDHLEQTGSTMEHQTRRRRRKQDGPLVVEDPSRAVDLRQLARYYLEEAKQNNNKQEKPDSYN